MFPLTIKKVLLKVNDEIKLLTTYLPPPTQSTTNLESVRALVNRGYT